jgi:arabinoxylan arabinofuranohydrolase
VAGFKSFAFEDVGSIRIRYGGRCDGVMQVSDDRDFARIAAEARVKAGRSPAVATAPLTLGDGVRALYFRFRGKGSLDFDSFEIN